MSRGAGGSQLVS